jgi:hypothetical protein
LQRKLWNFCLPQVKVGDDFAERSPESAIAAAPAEASLYFRTIAPVPAVPWTRSASTLQIPEAQCLALIAATGDPDRKAFSWHGLWR